jgi:hypothetical protein
LGGISLKSKSIANPPVIPSKKREAVPRSTARRMTDGSEYGTITKHRGCSLEAYAPAQWSLLWSGLL